MDTPQRIPIIDSHIHLFAESHLSRLSWAGDLPADHVLKRAHTVEVYKRASSAARNLAGFVFVETDRLSGLSDDQWEDALAEAAFLARVATGQPEPNEGHEAGDSKLVLGVVPWAPIPAGRQALERYVNKIWALYPGSFRKKVKGFRYLLQDKAPKVMLQDDFIDGLVWLGETNLSFDLGIDARQAGLFQLEEACQMMETLYGQNAQTRIVIGHFCKPNLRLSDNIALESHPDFVQWKACVEKMASHPHTYMKLSGLFSELLEQSTDDATSVETLLSQVRPWAEVTLKAFTSERVMFGSDWPVCNVGGPGSDKSWKHWHDLVTALMEDLKLDDSARRSIWYGTAAQAYQIQLPSITGN